jgi:hypothetical protein
MPNSPQRAAPRRSTISDATVASGGAAADGSRRALCSAAHANAGRAIRVACAGRVADEGAEASGAIELAIGVVLAAHLASAAATRERAARVARARHRAGTRRARGVATATCHTRRAIAGLALGHAHGSIAAGIRRLCWLSPRRAPTAASRACGGGRTSARPTSRLRTLAAGATSAGARAITTAAAVTGRARCDFITGIDAVHTIGEVEARVRAIAAANRAKRPR